MCLRAQLSIGDEELEQTLEAKNTGDKPFELTAALHTYIAVSSIEKVECPSTRKCHGSLLGYLTCRAAAALALFPDTAAACHGGPKQSWSLPC